MELNKRNKKVIKDPGLSLGGHLKIPHGLWRCVCSSTYSPYPELLKQDLNQYRIGRVRPALFCSQAESCDQLSQSQY